MSKDRLLEIAAGLARALEREDLKDARGYCFDLRFFLEHGRMPREDECPAPDA
jgi:hypothetical protein